ncbi:MAG: glycosyltransferase family 4 protein [Lachnospiraceae bacterium]
MESICIISQRYPCSVTPAVHVFVQKLAWEMADKGIDVHVISPVPVYDKAFRLLPEKQIELTSKGNRLTVYRPRFFYFGEKKIGPVRLSHLSADQMYLAAKNMIEKYSIDTEVFYGHFICVAGICACRLGRYYHKPAYIAYGESSDWSLHGFGLKAIKKEISEISGFVAVSTSNKNKLIKNGLADNKNVKVFVNGVNDNIFYPRDKKMSREKFGLNQNDFIVAFVGQFSDRKGVLRLSEALETMEEPIHAIYAGKGKLKPSGDHVSYCGIVSPEEIPFFLSASDVFVLPTQNEGCCNAVLEAIACGIPVVSSDCEFNYDILNQDYAVMINPDSIDEIQNAVRELYHNPDQRRQMRLRALEKSRMFTLKGRADKIIEWIDMRNKEYAQE